MKNLLVVVLVICLAFSGCSQEGLPETEGSSQTSSVSENTSVSSEQEASESTPASSESEMTEELQAALNLLRNELWERGIGDYRSADATVYHGNINGCYSFEEDVPLDQLLAFEFDFRTEEAPNYYMVAAITKDLQRFFEMSHVDGILYDIREKPAYVHAGEYPLARARQELEDFLAAETEIDPGQYRIEGEAKRPEGRAVYLFRLYQMEDPYDRCYEFLVSKDLEQIARIEYVEGPSEDYQYTETIELPVAFEKGKTYTMDEVEEILTQWLQQQRPFDTITRRDKEVFRKATIYRFWAVSQQDGISYLYRIPWDLSWPERYEVIETTEKLPQYTYLRG